MSESDRLERIFSESLQIHDPEERRAHVERTCGENLELAQQVFSLVAATEEFGHFLEVPLQGHEAIPVTTKTNAREHCEPLRMVFPFLSAPIEPDDIGMLGSYRILDLVGRGGMGIVFRAFDPKLQRIVAVKALAPEIAIDPTARLRFEREARSAAAVSHPHVVVIHAVDESHHPPFLVMEFVDGKTLAEKLTSHGMLSVKEVLRIGSQVADGLAAAHKQGLVHRDIKPANVLLENGVERAKLTDFGLARTVEDMTLSRTGDLSGTPYYMSPEQACGGPVDHRMDLFSLGAMLYTMCTGRPPFRADNPLATLKRICEDVPQPIEQINPEVPAWLSAVIVRLMAKSPADRFQSAAEVAAILENNLAMVQSGSRPSQAAGEAKIRPSLKPSQHRRSPLVWLLSGGFVAVTLLVVGNWLSSALHRMDESDASRTAADVGPPPSVPPTATPPTFTNGVGMEFVLVPKGKSWLGGRAGQIGDKHVEIKDDFYLGKYEVTQEEWEAVTGENPSIFKRGGHGGNQVADVTSEDLKRFPVEMVSWDDGQRFADALNKREHEAGWHYRLPTETEWEYACRGGPSSNELDSAHDFYLDKPTNDLLPAQANFGSGDKSLKRTCRVGSYQPNQLGLYDMHGNVWESCDDERNDSDEHAGRALRGGCWADPSHGCATTYRGFMPSNRNVYLGLRLARVPDRK